jgi:hypothetical protein
MCTSEDRGAGFPHLKSAREIQTAAFSFEGYPKGYGDKEDLKKEELERARPSLLFFIY